MNGIRNGTWDAILPLPYTVDDAQIFYELLTDKRYKHLVVNSNVLVVGSQSPWIEVLLLAAGVKHITTAEYGIIYTEHPQMSWIHPKDFNETLIDAFDIVVSYSSLEHAGLGRYGDPIDPINDIKVMNELSCLVKPNGLMFFGSPTSSDCIQFNGHRYYGPKRLRLMFMQWRIVDVSRNLWFSTKRCNHNQPWFVLQNKRGCFSF